MKMPGRCPYRPGISAPRRMRRRPPTRPDSPAGRASGATISRLGLPSHTPSGRPGTDTCRDHCTGAPCPAFLRVSDGIATRAPTTATTTWNWVESTATPCAGYRTSHRAAGIRAVSSPTRCVEMGLHTRQPSVASAGGRAISWRSLTLRPRLATSLPFSVLAYPNRGQI